MRYLGWNTTKEHSEHETKPLEGREQIIRTHLSSEHSVQANGDEDEVENGHALEDENVTVSFYVVVVVVVIAVFVEIIVVLLFWTVVVKCWDVNGVIVAAVDDCSRGGGAAVIVVVFTSMGFNMTVVETYSLEYRNSSD